MADDASLQADVSSSTGRRSGSLDVIFVAPAIGAMLLLGWSATIPSGQAVWFFLCLWIVAITAWFIWLALTLKDNPSNFRRATHAALLAVVLFVAFSAVLTDWLINARFALVSGAFDSEVAKALAHDASDSNEMYYSTGKMVGTYKIERIWVNDRAVYFYTDSNDSCPVSKGVAGFVYLVDGVGSEGILRKTELHHLKGNWYEFTYDDGGSCM